MKKYVFAAIILLSLTMLISCAVGGFIPMIHDTPSPDTTVYVETTAETTAPPVTAAPETDDYDEDGDEDEDEGEDDYSDEDIDDGNDDGADGDSGLPDDAYDTTGVSETT